MYKMAGESYDEMNYMSWRLTWRNSIKFGALLGLALSIEWLQKGEPPSAVTFAITLLFVIASLVVEGASAIVSRLEWIRRELYTLRLVGDTLLSRTAQLESRFSATAAVQGSELVQREGQHQQQQEYERLVEEAHEKSTYKHVPDLPWGDPSSYLNVHRRQEAEKREQNAREFLIRESERVQKERIPWREN
jgi:hypothetical protein